MCLTIKSRPNKLVQKCFKRLHKLNSNYETPYQGTLIPNDGLLVTRHIADKRIGMASISSGVIHCALNKTGRYFGCGEPHTAYAIKVMYYGTCDDLGCLAVYIPAADSTRKSKYDTTKQKALLNAKSNNDILKIFPQLKEKFEELKEKGYK